MAGPENSIPVYLETGKKRTFAGALDWPGWSRSGTDEPSALQALLACGPRYAQALRLAGLAFDPPAGLDAFSIVERLEGNATTDFGAPGMPPSGDERPVDDADLQRFQAILQASWQALDEAARRAEGKALRLGPRGGGRDLTAILEHVLGAQLAYLNSVGWKFKPDESAGLSHQLDQILHAAHAALASSARGEIERRGPRGGLRWSPRYFTRRTAWHVLDHAWEIEDRSG